MVMLPGMAIWFGGAGDARAATSSAAGLHTQVRLVHAGPIAQEQVKGRLKLPGPALLAGVRIVLDDGWKTYWRSPGDGIPPRFDWSGSTNVGRISVLWPAPKPFRDNAGAYVGYKKEVTFPVIVEPQQPGQPVDLRLHLDYAVCRDICIPVQTDLAEKLSAADTPEATTRQDLLSALARTPVVSETGNCGKGFAIRKVKADLDSAAPELVVDVAFPAGAKAPHLFVEAENGYYLPLAEEKGPTGKSAIRYRVDLAEGGDPASLRGKMLTITAAFEAKSCEVPWRVK